MKNKREISKLSTKNRILKMTKLLIVEKGILNTSTKEIADFCKVAHGTLFSHFNSRDQLISEVLKNELLRIAKDLYKLREEKSSLQELLQEYLTLVSKEEKFFEVIYKEFPFLNETLQREIITTESIVKKLLISKIEKGISLLNFKAVNPTTAIAFLFGTINYYLVRKEYYVSSGSVIQEKKENIIITFLTFLERSL